MNTEHDHGDRDGEDEDEDVVRIMIGILGTMLALVCGLILLQTSNTSSSHSQSLFQASQTVVDDDDAPATAATTTTTHHNGEASASASRFLPDPHHEPSKRAYEVFVLWYTPVWIVCFGAIIGCQWYEQYTDYDYLRVCGGLALPLLLQPVVWPGGVPRLDPAYHQSQAVVSPDHARPLHQRYALKANVWLAVYSFIGNYWYTHYFYSVLQARYTMPSHRFNNVPIPLYFATHFYFSTYHVFSNLLLRKIHTTYTPTVARTLLWLTTIGTFAYLTAFLETLTISAYPDYTFADRTMAYTIGSAFYGIYFVVSFPAFYSFDPIIDRKTTCKSSNSSPTLWETIVFSCGYGMMILILLDFVRLYLDIPLIVGSSMAEICSS